MQYIDIYKVITEITRASRKVRQKKLSSLAVTWPVQQSQAHSRAQSMSMVPIQELAHVKDLHICFWHVPVLEQGAYRDKLSTCLALALRTLPRRELTEPSGTERRM